MISALSRLQAIGAIEKGSVTVKGETFHIRSLTAEQRGELQAELARTGSTSELAVVAFACVNEDGSALTDSQEKTIALLKGVSGAVIGEVAAAIYKLSALTKGAIEAAEKN